jgi:hypothetical protein
MPPATQSNDMNETLELLDQWDGGISWTVDDDTMHRTSHALVVPGDDGDAVWVVDPIDADGLDEELADLGEVAGVVLLLDRHKRDSAAVAARHDVPVYLPEALADVADDLDCDIETFRGTLPGTEFRTITLTNNSLWREVALYDKNAGTLVVPEAVGTAGLFTAPGERLGVHPGLRLLPPKAKLGGLRPDRILVGHGAGVFDDAPMALQEALRGSRRNAPKLYAGMLTLPFK